MENTYNFKINKPLGKTPRHKSLLNFLSVRNGGDGVVAGHGDGLVRPVAGSGVDLGLSNSGLRFGATAASMLDLRPTAGATWNRLGVVFYYFVQNMVLGTSQLPG